VGGVRHRGGESGESEAGLLDPEQSKIPEWSWDPGKPRPIGVGAIQYSSWV